MKKHFGYIDNKMKMLINHDFEKLKKRYNYNSRKFRIDNLNI